MVELARATGALAEAWRVDGSGVLEHRAGRCRAVGDDRTGSGAVRFADAQVFGIVDETVRRAAGIRNAGGAA